MFITEKNLLKVGFVLNSFYIFFLYLFNPDGFTILNVSITSLLSISFLILMFLCFRNRRLINEIPTSAKTVFKLLLLWGLLITIRSFSLNIQDWITNFGSVYMALAWFTPALVVLGQNIGNWEPVVKALLFIFQFILTVFILVLLISDFTTAEFSWIIRPVTFLLLIGLYRFNFVNRLTIYFTVIIYLVVSFLTELRVDFIYLSLVFLFIFVDRFKNVKIKKTLFKYILFGFVILLWLVFTLGYENISNFISRIIEFQDSRTFLYTELFEDLTTIEHFIGRGSLGTYYSDFFERTRRYWESVGGLKAWKGDSPTRLTIEVGYLQMILKGGYVLFGLSAFLMFYSAYLALFKSNSKFIKRLGIFILIISILSVISFRPAFTPTFIIMWMAIGTVLNKRNRKLNNDEIDKLIKL